MKPAFVLTLVILAASAFFLVRSVHESIRDRKQGITTWVVWFWLGLWGVALVYGIASAGPHLVSGESSAFLAIGVGVVSAFSWSRLWGHYTAT